MKRSSLITFLLVCGLYPTTAALAADAQVRPIVVQRNAWSYDSCLLDWYTGSKPDQEKQAGTLRNVNGWTEYRFDIAKTGWYALWAQVVPEWSRDWFLDGKQIFSLKVSQKGDNERNETKEGNLFLTAGSHTLRFRRLGFPGWLCTQWELRDETGDPLGSITAKFAGSNVIRAGGSVDLRVTAGGPAPVKCTIVARNEETNVVIPVGALSLPALAAPVTRNIPIVIPHQGVYTLLPVVDGVTGRPADLAAGQVIAVDTTQAPAAQSLSRTLVADIDCVKQAPLRDKDGASTLVNASFGAYRESSGKGSNENWATDGFSYAFDLPDADGPYQLEVDYPDDDRRTMGFWVNDQMTGNVPSIPLTGGVETGDRYRVSNSMLTHVATFWPLNKHIVFAVVNLDHGMKAAAARVRVYKINNDFDAGPAGRPDGRRMGYYYEESSRWLLHFGAKPGLTDTQNSMITMDRWGRFNRYMGANLMFPTINVYQDNRFPSKVLEGYFNTTDDQCRMNALFADKYGDAYIPEFHVSGQAWFDKHVMGVWVDPAMKDATFASPSAEGCVLRDKQGRAAVNGRFFYNPLNPIVQDKYIAALGELADDLGDTKSFAGISSRLMLSWQWMGWNALPGLNWGYDDWTIAQFEKETGVKTPGAVSDPDRFNKRYQFLVGRERSVWIKWRCDRIYAYHQRILARMRRAKPSADLFFTWYGQDPAESTSADTLIQLRDAGIDASRYGPASGMEIIPVVSYGRRYSSPVADANATEPLFDGPTKSLGLDSRAGSNYGAYFEAGDPGWKAFGANNDRFINDVCTPSGRNELEDYAVLLADCDCSVLSAGAYGQIYGSPNLMREFLSEYTALPAVPFAPLSSGRDPVAVWYRSRPDGLYFYAVNRERYPVSVALSIEHASRIVSLSSGEALSLNGDVLNLAMKPYQLRSFRAAAGAAISKCVESIPGDEKSLLAAQISFVDSAASRLRDRSLALELTQSQCDDCLRLIKDSDQAFASGQYWRARTNLEQPPMINLYDLIGAYPPSLQYRKVQRGFQKTVSAPSPKLAAATVVGDVRGKLSGITDLCFDSTGRLWAASSNQVMSFDSSGQYVRSLRLTAPYTLCSGDPRWAGVTPPVYFGAEALRVLGDGKVAATSYWMPIVCFEPKTGRVARVGAADSIGLPGHPAAFDTDKAGNYYVACVDPAANAGVIKFSANGAAAYDFARVGEPSNRLCDFAATGVAVDAAGRIYVSDRDHNRVVEFDNSGRQVDVALVTAGGAPGRLAVTSGGDWLFAALRDGGVAAWQRQATGSFVLRWTKSFGARATSLAVNASGVLAVGFAAAADGAVVRCYRCDVQGAVDTGSTIGTTDALIPRILTGSSTLEEYQGSIYYLTGGKLARLTPGASDTSSIVFDPKIDPLTFAFDQAGNLFLSSRSGSDGKRGEYVWRCLKAEGGWSPPVSLTGNAALNNDSTAMIPFGLAIANDGTVLVRSEDKDNWPVMRIFGLTPGGDVHPVVEVGGMPATAPWDGYYGLHVDRSTGRILVAGGPSHALICLNSDSTQRWRIENSVAQLPGQQPLRGPMAVTTDREGRVWVADADANRILCFDPEGNYLASFGRCGGIDARDGFSMDRPTGIATVVGSDGAEWLYVADSMNMRIIKYRIDSIRP